MAGGRLGEGARLTARVELRAPLPDDAAIVAALLNAHATATGGAESTTTEEVCAWFALPGLDPARDMRIAVGSDGELYGYADIAAPGDGPVHVDLRVPPAHAGVSALLLEAMELRAAERGAPPRPLRVHAAATDAPLAQLLAVRGYEAVRSSYRMEASLSAPPPPVWPDGLRVRPYDRHADLAAVHEAAEHAFADHWGYQPLTLEEWRGWNVRDSLDPTLWFLAVEGETVAGICLCRLDETPDPELGWVSVLGVRPPWRKRGLARALLHHAFGALHRRGCTRVGFGVDAESTTGAVALYESVGMRVVHRSDTYERGRA